MIPTDFTQLDWPAPDEPSPIEDDLRQLVRLAVREDLDRFHDWTTLAIVDADAEGSAAVAVRKPGVIAGLRAVPIIIDEMHAAIDCEFDAADGDEIAAGGIVATLSGKARDLLVCERPILNLLGHLSGIATRTREFVRAIEGTKARIYDTRKTTPGWRRLEKYAVRCGGASNHRTGLYDAILIKDNHLAFAAGEKISPADAVRRARDFLAETAVLRENCELLVEIEIDRLDQLDTVLAAGPDIVLLDNMRPETLREAVARRDEFARRDATAPSIELEASGGVNLGTVRAIAESGVDRISVGEVTHSAPALDIGLDWLPAT
jgi:nicotinate-nucleotide pyrophosphorylase (carboxylating)